MTLYNSGSRKRQLGNGIVQDLFDDGSPTTSYTFPIAVWHTLKVQGFFDSPEGRYVFAGNAAVYNAIGSVGMKEAKISFWPKR